MGWSAVLSESLGLRVAVDRGEDASVTVRLAGESGVASAKLARSALEQLGAETKRIVLDLSQVTCLSSAGIRLLLTARARASAVGGEFMIRNPTSAVRRVLELTGILPVISPGEPGGISDQAAIGDQAAFGPDVVAICEAVVASAIRVGGAAMGNAQIADPATGALWIVAQRGFRRPFLDFFETVHGEESACGAALGAGQPVWVVDVATSPIFAGTPAGEVMREAGCHAVASVPVLAGDGSVTAMISTHRRRPTTWTEGQKSQLEALAASVGELLTL
jgi:anti-anti-sigma factor